MATNLVTSLADVADMDVLAPQVIEDAWMPVGTVEVARGMNVDLLCRQSRLDTLGSEADRRQASRFTVSEQPSKGNEVRVFWSNGLRLDPTSDGFDAWCMSLGDKVHMADVLELCKVTDWTLLRKAVRTAVTFMANQ